MVFGNAFFGPGRGKVFFDAWDGSSRQCCRDATSNVQFGSHVGVPEYIYIYRIGVLLGQWKEMEAIIQGLTGNCHAKGSTVGVTLLGKLCVKLTLQKA